MKADLLWVLSHLKYSYYSRHVIGLWTINVALWKVGLRMQTTRTAHNTQINKWYARNTYIALWMDSLRMVSNCFDLITHIWEWGVNC